MIENSELNLYFRYYVTLQENWSYKVPFFGRVRLWLRKTFTEVSEILMFIRFVIKFISILAKDRSLFVLKIMPLRKTFSFCIFAIFVIDFRRNFVAVLMELLLVVLMHAILVAFMFIFVFVSCSV